MPRRTLCFAAIVLLTGALGAAPTAQQKEVIDWVLRNQIQEQQRHWDDWSSPSR